MGNIRNDLTGKRFGRLTVVEPIGKSHRVTIWKCVCDCGNEVNVLSSSLTSGSTSSCGCLHKEKLIEYNHTKTIHGGSKERLYSVWIAMVSRCENSLNKKYKNYGGRGICVCEQWKDYPRFRNWALANGYDETAKRGECTLERIDNNGNYDPTNCRWATQAEQTLNTRQNIRYEIAGERKTLSEISKEYNIKYTKLYYRVHHNRSIDEAIAELI